MSPPALASMPAFISPGDVAALRIACFCAYKFTLIQQDTARIRIPFAAKSRYLHEIPLDWIGFHGIR